MKKLVSLLVAVSMMFSVCAGAQVFTDVPEGHYSYTAAMYLKEKGILSGYEDGSFGPHKNVTRAEMAAIVCRMAQIDTAEIISTDFADVPAGSWAVPYIAGAAKAGIINGDGNGIFRPDHNVTYEEAIKMSICAAGLNKLIMPNPNDWSAPYLTIAEEAGITKGLTGKKGEASTRADIALMVYNTLMLNPDDTLTAFCARTYNENYSIVANVNFLFDTKVFFGDNNTYNKELSKTSSVLSMLAYPYISTVDSKRFTASTLLKEMGFEDVASRELSKDYTDNHLTQVFTGHKTIYKDGSSAELIPIIIRGTNGSSEEWSSNFDIGPGDGTNAESKTKENHEGYDITALRVIQFIENYEKENIASSSPRIYWITGHSRGGSVANICAVYLGNSGKKCFAYTFAASNSTTSKDVSKYGYIFNIVNKDDPITYIPMKEWGFANYGKSSQVSLYEDYLSQWSNITGLKKYNKYDGDISELTASLASCAPSRKACYEYTDDAKIVNQYKTEADAQKSIEVQKSSFAPSSLKYCKFEITKSKTNTEYPYILETHMQPAFILQNTAAILGGEVNLVMFTFLDIPDNIKGVAIALVGCYFSGKFVHPHTPETYFVLSQNLKAEAFK